MTTTTICPHCNQDTAIVPTYRSGPLVTVEIVPPARFLWLKNWKAAHPTSMQVIRGLCKVVPTLAGGIGGLFGIGWVMSKIYPTTGHPLVFGDYVVDGFAGCFFLLIASVVLGAIGMWAYTWGEKSNG